MKEVLEKAARITDGMENISADRTLKELGEFSPAKGSSRTASELFTSERSESLKTKQNPFPA